MHRYIVLFFALVIGMLVVAPISTYADDTQSLSIQEALDTAYKHNPDLVKAELEVDKASILRDDAAKAVTWIPTGGLVSPVYQQVFNSYQQAEIGLDTAKKARDAEKDRITKEVIAAYAQAIKDYNTMEVTRLSLENMKEQRKVNSLAKEVGYVAENDYENFKSGLNSLENGYAAAKAKYDSSIAALGALLGKGSKWNPELTSRAILSNYKRHELNVEINRALSESVLVMQQQALLDIEESKQNWILPNVSSDMRQIDLDMAEIDYEQAKRTARSTIEGLYHTIDALEGQVSAAELAWQTAQNNLEVARLKYELGMIPKVSMPTSPSSLNEAELEAEKKRMELENLKADLAQTKATFAYLTGHTVFQAEDWMI